MSLRRFFSKLYTAAVRQRSHDLLVMRVLPFIFLGVLPAAAAEPSYVARYDFYAGFAYLHTPILNLSTRGYHLQAAINTKSWLALGFDYSHSNGSLTLYPKYLPTDLRNQVDGILQFAPPGYDPGLTTDVNTQTFAMGPALVFRKIKGMAFILHPSIGAVREYAVPYPTDTLKNIIVSNVVPARKKLDWQGFYGIGGGIDFRVAKHMSIRLHTDFVWDHLFDDIIRDGRWTVRTSFGPAFHFGRDIR